MQEIYKDIVGYEGLYQVSNLGNIKSLKYGKERILKPGTNTDGYLTVILRENNISKNFRLHRLVAMAFIPNLDNKEQVNHINGSKDDNRVDNLEWCTQNENIQHAFNIGLNIGHKGENNGRCKLTKKQVLEIKKDNRTQKLIAKDYNVSQAQIGFIKKGISWAHL